MPQNEDLKNLPADTSTHSRSFGWDRDYESIMKHFEWYGFFDKMGHDLIHCADFQQMVRGYVEGKKIP